MVAVSSNNNNSGGLGFFGVVLIFLVFAFAVGGGFIYLSNQSENVMLYQESNHANTKHPDEVSLVRNSCDNGGVKEIWENPNTNRIAKICSVVFDGKNKWGVQILTEDEQNEITAFIKRKMNTLEQVQKYLTNQGYIPK